MAKRLTTAEFIKRAKEIHGDKDDLSKVDYKNNKTKICIICPIHGEFWIRPEQYLKGKGCPKCANNQYTTEQFIEKARKIHGFKDDLSQVDYINSHTKIKIICPIHGEYEIKPYLYLQGYRCTKCSNYIPKYTTEEWINAAKRIHGDKYDYSKVIYINNHTKVCIICKECGNEFWIIPTKHLYQKHGCPKCAHQSYAYTTKEWVEKAQEKHKDKDYIYTKVEYVNNHTKVCIICPEHGEFWQIPSNHLNGAGCPKCGKKSMSQKRTKRQEDFINESIKIFGDLLDYSKVKYIDNKTKVCLICKKHGEFWVRPDMHLHYHNGCPQCAAETNVKETKLYNTIIKYFPEFNFVHSKRNIEGLGLLELDIFSDKTNIAIEYQGDQHFKPVDFFGKELGFKSTLERDKRKIQLCKNLGIKLFYFTYNKNYCKDNIGYEVITDEEILLQKIREAIT